jgi:PAS domain S-box-containing protein
LVGNGNAAIGGTVGRPLINILLVEDNLAEARLLQEILKGAILSRFNLTHVQRLGEAIALLKSSTSIASVNFQPTHSQSVNVQQPPLDTILFDVILLDLTLPDSYGLASLDALIQHAPNLPIVVLTNTNDDQLAVQAVRQGAQDYLVKRHLNQDNLVRSLHYAIERKQGAEALREANEILETRVQERTAELETANERLRQEIEWCQKIQERLELAQKAGRIGPFEWNVQSNAVTWTAELEALYGLAAGSFANQYDGWIKTIHPDDRPKTEQELEQAIKLGEGLNTEFRIILPDGEVRWIAVKSSLFHDQTGKPLRMIGIHMDITEKKQLEAQFLRAQRLESLGTLASGIAHDLNNILTPILAVVQLLPLKLPDLNDSTRQMLKAVDTSAHRGAELIKQILSFTRGVEGKRLSLQIHHLLLEIIQIIQQTLPKSIDINTNISPDLLPILGDATQLHQVFMNLCVNARDAMPYGGKLTITANNLLIDESYTRMHLDASVGPYVVITIADTGMGIPLSNLHRIFDPFFTTKDIGKGTGLGLSAVLGIVKSHGGFVDVQSEVGKGSQFQVFLPASQSIESQMDDEVELLSGQQELILVVDDEVAICEVTKTTLEAYNYQVLTANDGIEAIALFAEHKDAISGVLMDIMMPSMDGLTTLPLLRRLNPHVQAIAMSGLRSIEAVTQAEKQGFQSFLPKPFTTKDLLHTLQNGLCHNNK